MKARKIVAEWSASGALSGLFIAFICFIAGAKYMTLVYLLIAVSVALALISIAFNQLTKE